MGVVALAAIIFVAAAIGAFLHWIVHADGRLEALTEPLLDTTHPAIPRRPSA